MESWEPAAGKRIDCRGKKKSVLKDREVFVAGLGPGSVEVEVPGLVAS